MSQTSDVGGETHVIHLSDPDLWLVRAALQEYLASFSHTEGEIVDALKDLLERLPTVGDPEAAVNQIFPGRGLTL